MYLYDDFTNGKSDKVHMYLQAAYEYENMCCNICKKHWKFWYITFFT